MMANRLNVVWLLLFALSLALSGCILRNRDHDETIQRGMQLANLGPGVGKNDPSRGSADQPLPTHIAAAKKKRSPADSVTVAARTPAYSNKTLWGKPPSPKSTLVKSLPTPPDDDLLRIPNPLLTKRPALEPRAASRLAAGDSSSTNFEKPLPLPPLPPVVASMKNNSAAPIPSHLTKEPELPALPPLPAKKPALPPPPTFPLEKTKTARPNNRNEKLPLPPPPGPSLGNPRAPGNLEQPDHPELPTRVASTTIPKTPTQKNSFTASKTSVPLPPVPPLPPLKQHDRLPDVPPQPPPNPLPTRPPEPVQANVPLPPPMLPPPTQVTNPEQPPMPPAYGQAPADVQQPLPPAPPMPDHLANPARAGVGEPEPAILPTMSVRLPLDIVKTKSDIQPLPVSPPVKTNHEQPKNVNAPPDRLVPRPLPLQRLKTVSHVPDGKPAGSVAKLYRLAANSFAAVDSYIVRFRRREKVNGKNRPEELMLLKVRKDPWSLYFKWLGGEGKNREVIFVKGRYQNKIHTRLAAGDVPLMPAGKVMAFAPTSPLVLAKSRHPITDAGIGNLIARFGKLAEHVERGEHRLGTLKYLGLLRRREFSDPVEAVLQIIPPGVEKTLPRGGRRFWYFDTKLRFPVLVITQDVAQQEVEYYCFDRFLFPGRLSDDEFNPDILWRK